MKSARLGTYLLSILIAVSVFASGFGQALAEPLSQTNPAASRTAPAAMSVYAPSSAQWATATRFLLPIVGSRVRWIDINLTKQRLIAYQGYTPIFSTLISSGVAKHKTTPGTFHIYAKLRSQEMRGGVGAEHYDLPNVPYVMYFYGGNAIHGTYWHHNFGHPMSHGCINTPTSAAAFLYRWASIGTMVRVHY